jgi:hypothetical protein
MWKKVEISKREGKDPWGVTLLIGLRFRLGMNYKY